MIGKELPAALLLNADDWGFGYFEMDDLSVKVFEQCLSKVVSQLDRAVVIGQLISMMRQLTYPATRMTIVINQLINEENQNLITAMVDSFHQAQQSFLPPETVPKFNKETCAFFIAKAKKDRNNEKLSTFCIDKCLGFATEKEHLQLISDWIMNGQIKIDNEILPIQLTPDQKHLICKWYFASPHFSHDSKKALLNKALEGDSSDKAQNVAKVCAWSLPDAALKQQLFDEFTDSSTKDSLMDLRLKMAGFWQR